MLATHNLLNGVSAAAISRYLMSDPGDRMPALTVTNVRSEEVSVAENTAVSYPTPGAPDRIVIIACGQSADGAGSRRVDAVTVNTIEATLIAGPNTIGAYSHSFWAVAIPASDSIDLGITMLGTGTIAWRVIQIEGVSWSEFIEKVEYQDGSGREPALAIAMDGPGLIIGAIGFTNAVSSHFISPIQWYLEDGDLAGEYTTAYTARRVADGTFLRNVAPGAGVELVGGTIYQNDSNVPSFGALILKTAGANTFKPHITMATPYALEGNRAFTGTQTADLRYTGSNRECLVCIYHASTLTGGIDGMTLVASQLMVSGANSAYLSVYRARLGSMPWPLRLSQATSGRLWAGIYALESSPGEIDFTVIEQNALDGVQQASIGEYTSPGDEKLFLISAVIAVTTNTGIGAVPDGWEALTTPVGSATNRRMGFMTKTLMSKNGDVEPSAIFSPAALTSNTAIGWIYLAARFNPSKKQELQRMVKIAKYNIAKLVGSQVAKMAKYSIVKFEGVSISKLSKYTIVKAV